MSKQTLFSFMISPGLRNEASEKAKSEHLSLSALIRRLLTDYVNQPRQVLKPTKSGPISKR